MNAHHYLVVSIKSNASNNIFDHIENGILITDADSTIIYTNPAFTRITGYTAAEMLGQNPGMLHSGRHKEEFYQEMWSHIESKGYWEGEIWNRKKTGEIFPEYLTISTLSNDKNQVCNYIAIMSDISYLKKDIYKKLKLALYDPLTELPNRTLYHDRVNHAIHQGKIDPKLKHAILFMDLNKFKQVNDTYGHLVGDHLLRQVGERLSSVIRACDTVARVGGDEFMAILYGISDKATIEKLSNRMVDAIEKPFIIDGQEIKISISIGICIYPTDAHHFEDLMSCADKAMYAAKKQNSKVEFYTD